MKKILLILLLLIIYPLSVGAEDVQSADGSFTWSIPSSLNLSEDVHMDIAIKNIALEENKILDVKVSSANNFKLISESAQEITYELYDDGNTKLSSGDTVLKYQKGTTDKTTNSLTVDIVDIPDDVTTGRFSDNLTFTANVSDDPNYYTISYNLDGGTLEGSYPTMYSSSKGLDSLPTPTKDGYVFAGWQEINDVPVTINDNWGKNDDGSVYIDYSHYDSSVSTYAPSTMAEMNNYLEFVLENAGSISVNAEIVCNEALPTYLRYQIIKDEVVIIDEQSDSTTTSLKTGFNYDLLPGDYLIILNLVGSNTSKAIFSNLLLSQLKIINSIPAGTTGNKTLTAKWEKEMPNKGDIVTLSDLGLTNADMNADSTNDTFRVLSVDGSNVKILAMDSYASVTFGSNNTYSGSTLDTKMTEYYNALPSDVQNAIVEQNISQSKYSWSSGANSSASFSSWYKFSFTESDVSGTNYYLTRTTEVNVGNRKVYALDVDDVIAYLGSSSTPQDLNELFFSKRFSVSRNVWLRSASAANTGRAFYVRGLDGRVFDGLVDDSDYCSEVRPAFVIDLSQISFAQAASTLSLRNDEPVTQESIININYVTSSGITMTQDQITGNMGETITYYPEEYEGYTTDESIELTFTEDEQSIDVIYTPIEYTINFSEGLEPIAYTIESENIVLPSLEEEGFLGWMNGDVPIEMIEAGSTGSFELTAKFETAENKEPEVDTETVNINEESSEGAEENSSTQGNETSGTTDNNVVAGTEETNGESETNKTE